MAVGGVVCIYFKLDGDEIMEIAYAEVQARSRERWAACGFKPDGTLEISDGYNETDIESWRQQLQAQDEEELRVINEQFKRAAMIIQRSWRRWLASRKTATEIFILM